MSKVVIAVASFMLGLLTTFGMPGLPTLVLWAEVGT